MEYQKVNIVSFRGLNANVQPDLIEDNSAADIENLRFDKQGYLINRNGVEMKPLFMQRQVYIDIVSDLYPIGTMGITEYKIDEPFGIEAALDGREPYDDVTLANLTTASQADRFMVYAIRLPANDGFYQTDDYNAPDHAGAPAEGLTWRYKMAYVLSPLKGKNTWRDIFFFSPNGYPEITGDPDNTVSSLWATAGTRSVNRPDDTPKRMQLYAPVRWLGEHNETVLTDGTAKDLNWIEHYVDMNQYRKGVVISDRINGDMFLVDEAQESEYDDDDRHYFSLRQNAVVEFDVDDVVVDFGTDANGFNDGVEAPIVLYRYYLPKRRGISTVDHYKPYYTAVTGRAPSWEKATLLENANYNGSIYTVFTWRMPESKDNFLLTELTDDTNGDEWRITGVAFNTTRRYSFTMNEHGDDIYDLFGTLTFENPDAVDEEGSSPDAYRWDDFELTYYPVSGKDQNELFLRAKDRDFDRLSAGGTRAIKLRTKAGFEQEVPLGVWRYRFVWYMGNGEYSTASTELTVPDLLFSGLKDADVVAAVGEYKRPAGMDDEQDAYRTGLEVGTAPADNFFNQTAAAQGVKIFEGTTLTELGESFIRLKEAIYEPDHVHAAYHSSTSGASWPANWSTESLLAMGQVQVTTTVYFPDDVGTFAGTVGESGYTQFDDAEDYTLNDYGSVNFKFYRSAGIQLNVQLFPTSDSPSESHGFNSVFTEYGVPRILWQNKDSNSGLTGYSATVPAYQIVFEGKVRFGMDANLQWEMNPVVTSGSKVFVNLVGIQSVEDQNNSPDDEEYPAASGIYRRDYRNMSVVRGVRDQRDRMSVLKDGLPQEVITRLVVSGTGEFTIADYGDKGTWAGQIQRFPTDNTNYLLRATAREFPRVDSLVWCNPYYGGSPYDYFMKGYTTRPGAPAEKAFVFENLRLVVSGRGERFTGIEQMTAFFPASIAFEAPRVKLTIPADRVPRRAKQLLIFRTRASHDNNWIPTEYGLVENVELIRDDTGALTGDHAAEVSFLDDVKSDDLDFSYDLSDYEAFTEPIKSRFNTPLNERVFYANLIETYRPRRPRNSVRLDPWDETPGPADPLNLPHRNLNYPASHPEMVRLWTWKVFDGEAATTEIPAAANYLYYFLVYEDAARSFSLAAYSGEIDRSDGGAITASQGQVVLICAPSQYDTLVDKAAVYRLATATQLTEIRLNASSSVAAPVDKVYMVVQGEVEYHGEIYGPKQIILTTAGNGNDSGVPSAKLNRFVNSFTGTGTGRGHYGSHGDPILLDITDHVTGGAGPFMERIGSLEPEDEGIFHDKDLPSTGRLSLRQLLPKEENLESGIRWSEPYEPNKIKLASLVEARSGDGDQITGLAMNYGNLLVFKERSIHRMAVQGEGVPISRTDEVSDIIGCIAPNTVLSINDSVYFLSWSGFYRYNNNVLEKADGAFAEELQQRLRSVLEGQPNSAIRDASCGWNPTYREIYLNIPLMTAGLDENGNTSYIYDNLAQRNIRGTVYAINIDNGQVTKYRYMDDARYFTDPANVLGIDAVTQRSPRVQGRLYYHNSMGQMRSAEILPPRTKDYVSVVVPTSLNESRFYMHSTFYLESPTKEVSGQDKWTDDYYVYEADLGGYAGTSMVIETRYVHTFWKTKSFTAGDKTVLKRVMKTFAYIESTSEPAVIRGRIHSSPEGSKTLVDREWEHTYSLTGSPTDPVTGELLGKPTADAGASTSPSQTRGERYEFEVEAGGRVQIEYFGFYWMPINTYER